MKTGWTNEVPTRDGYYQIRQEGTDFTCLAEWKQEEKAFWNGCQWSGVESLKSHSWQLLVPSSAVEEAYREGLAAGLSAGKPLYVTALWNASHAKRVAEGGV